jgi:hypothetical protein
MKLSSQCGQLVYRYAEVKKNIAMHSDGRPGADMSLPGIAEGAGDDDDAAAAADAAAAGAMGRVSETRTAAAKIDESLSIGVAVMDLVGRVGTFVQIILQLIHPLMTASTSKVHVTNLTPGSANPTRREVRRVNEDGVGAVGRRGGGGGWRVSGR